MQSRNSVFSDRTGPDDNIPNGKKYTASWVNPSHRSISVASHHSQYHSSPPISSPSHLSSVPNTPRPLPQQPATTPLAHINGIPHQLLSPMPMHSDTRFSEDELLYARERAQLGPMERIESGYEQGSRPYEGRVRGVHRAASRNGLNQNGYDQYASIQPRVYQPPPQEYEDHEHHNGFGDRSARLVGGIFNGFRRIPNLWRRGHSDESLRAARQLTIDSPVARAQQQRYPSNQLQYTPFPSTHEIVRPPPFSSQPTSYFQSQSLHPTERLTSRHVNGSISGQPYSSDNASSAPNGYTYDSGTPTQSNPSHPSHPSQQFAPPPIDPIPSYHDDVARSGSGSQSGSQTHSEAASDHANHPASHLARLQRVLHRTGKFPWIGNQRITTVYYPEQSSSRSRSRQEIQDLAYRNHSGMPGGHAPGSSWYTPSPVQQARMIRSQNEKQMRLREAKSSEMLAYIPGFAQSAGAYFVTPSPVRTGLNINGIQEPGLAPNVNGIIAQSPPLAAPQIAMSMQHPRNAEHSPSSSETLNPNNQPPATIPIQASNQSPNPSPPSSGSQPGEIPLPTSPNPIHPSHSRGPYQFQFSPSGPQPQQLYSPPPGHVFVIADSRQLQSPPAQPMYFLPTLVASHPAQPPGGPAGFMSPAEQQQYFAQVQQQQRIHGQQGG